MEDRSLREEVALACRILHRAGQNHFYLGHVSTRISANHLLVKPAGLGLGEVTTDDVVVADLDGNLVEGKRGLHHEMPIHTKIYGARGDVKCVVHTHPPYSSALSAAKAKFKLVSQDSVLFLDRVGYYESPELVVTDQQGAELAQALGDGSVVILQNHGIAVAAESIPVAVFLAISFERSVFIQCLASQLGEVREISAKSARRMHAYFEEGYRGRKEAMWEYLRREVLQDG